MKNIIVLEPPEIKIEDPAKFATVACFIDQEDVRSAILLLRQRLGIEQPLSRFMPVSDLGSWGVPGNTPLWSLENLLKQQSYAMSKDEAAEANDVFERLESLESHHTTLDKGGLHELEELRSLSQQTQTSVGRTNRAVEKMMASYKTGNSMRKVILAATLFGDILESEYQDMPLNGSYKSIQDTRAAYWQHKPHIVGYKKLAKTYKTNSYTVIRERIKNYESRLKNYHDRYHIPLELG